MGAAKRNEGGRWEGQHLRRCSALFLRRFQTDNQFRVNPLETPQGVHRSTLGHELTSRWQKCVAQDENNSDVIETLTEFLPYHDCSDTHIPNHDFLASTRSAGDS